MSKYVPKIIQELYQHEEYRGKTLLIYNTTYDEADNLTSYEIYKVYDKHTSEATKDWAKLAEKFNSVKEVRRNVFFEWVPADLDAVEYL